jgi:hypothetical protein
LKLEASKNNNEEDKLPKRNSSNILMYFVQPSRVNVTGAFDATFRGLGPLPAADFILADR